MSKIQMIQTGTDFYTTNSDFTGKRDVEDSHELVQFHKSTSVRVWCNEQPDGYDTHWHNALEIIIPVANYYESVIKNTLYHIQPGEILIIPPGELHKLIAPPSGQRFIFLFDISHLTNLKGFSGIQSLLAQPIFITKDNYPYIHEDVYQDLVHICNEYFNKNEYAELTIFSLLIQMLVRFGYNHINTLDLFPNVRISKKKEYVKKFNELMDYIDHHYMEDLNLDSIASETGFSKFHFSRLFKQYTNFTFCDYLTYRRIKVAESLLSEPDLSITEVALQSGFPSISTFNRIFKQEKNCTPSEYRAKNNQYTINTRPLDAVTLKLSNHGVKANNRVEK